MLTILTYIAITILVLLTGLILMARIRVMRKKYRYRNRQFGETRTWDLGQTGDVNLIYQLDPEDNNQVQVALQLHQANGCTQTTTWNYKRSNASELYAYAFFKEADEEFIKDEVSFLVDKSLNGFADLGIRPKPTLVKE